jgi:acylphosphatase
MKRLTAYVSGKVQKVGYRARVMEIARILGLKGIVGNTEDGRVKIVAEGDDDKLRWFEDAINIKNTLIQVSSIEKEYSPAGGEFDKFYKLVEPGETDSRLDTAAVHLKDLIVAVNNMNNNLGGKIDQMNDNLSGKMDRLIEGQDGLSGKMDRMLDKQDDLLNEVRETRRDLKGYLDQRFEKVEGEVAEIKTALKAKGII